MAGASFEDIAESLGYANRAGAHKAVMTAIESTLPVPAAQVRELELKRLDRLWLGVWDAATKGDFQAVDACLKIMKRRADFEGLDKAKKLEHAGPDGQSIPVKHEHVNPEAFVSAFKSFADAVLGQRVARILEDGSLEPEPSPGER
jgi:hypothetical protein